MQLVDNEERQDREQQKHAAGEEKGAETNQQKVSCEEFV
jgi:hypothetical protein